MTNEPENTSKKNQEEQGGDKPKKNTFMLFRPENSRTGSVKKGQRPGSTARRKPEGAPGRKTQSGSSRPAASAAAAQKSEEKKTAPVQTAASENVKPAESTVKPAQETIVKAPAAETAAKTSVQETAAKSAAPETAPKTNDNETAAKTTSADTAAKAGGKTSEAVQAESKTVSKSEETNKKEDAPAKAAEVKSAEKTPVSSSQNENTERSTEKSVDRSGNRNNNNSNNGSKGYRSRRDDSRGGYRNDRGGQSGSSQGSRSASGQGRSNGNGSFSRTGSGQGGSGRNGGGSFSRGGSGNGSFGNRGGFAKPAAGDKPFEKESRKNDRSRDNRKNDRPDRGDKFDRLEKKGSQGRNGKPQTKNNRPNTKPVVKEEPKDKIIVIPETLTLKELADKLKIAPAAIIKKLFLQGKMVTVNQDVSFDEAEEIAMEYDVICEKEVKVDVIEELLKEEEDAAETLQSRPPVVCVMGHVDHGKTSLLDAIRNTRVIDREAGGITQHIGASVVECNGQKITFLDTPGHEAFTAMRMRGASSTDIAILVVAADDGVMPQTVEAINHAKAAGIEIIVAINKIDKPSANIEKVKQELTEYELIPEDWGGSTIFVPVSARTHEGIDSLLEMVLLTSEVLELRANPNRRARGLVIEAKLDKGRGPVATVLVQKGTLHVGDPIAAGSCYGRVRAMIDDKGAAVKQAGPSTPVEILGFSDVPGAGEVVISTPNEKEARSFAETFISEGREKMLDETKQKMSLDDLFSKIQAGSLKELNLIVKADVQGSVEAVKQSLLKLSNEEVVVKVIHSAVGAVNESDVTLASASSAIIIAFNVRPDAQAKSTAEHEGVDVRLYRVIYDAIADVEAAMKGMLDPVFEEKVIGHGEIRQTFKASGVGTIAGSYVLDGIFQRGCKVRITREGKLIYDGDLASLKRFKDDVKEVRAGYECGLVFEKFNDLKELDQLEAYTMVEVAR